MWNLYYWRTQRSSLEFLLVSVFFNLFIAVMKPFQLLYYSHLAILSENIVRCLWCFSNIKKQMRAQFCKIFETHLEWLKALPKQGMGPDIPFLYYADFHKSCWKVKSKGRCTKSRNFIRVTPAFCDKGRKERNKDISNLFSLHLSVDLSF